ncbi:metalloregulator ArsR/SmtB family transcription factor [Ochrobactrum sp. GPK 3]|uniref:ArsR/SmtB family transcription factor n=1 Tax=Brucella sp. 22210 TaxID=3453892 RepID=UPI0031384AE7
MDGERFALRIGIYKGPEVRTMDPILPGSNNRVPSEKEMIMDGVNSKQISNIIARRERIVEVFALLANANRLHIISLILNKEMSVGDIAEAVGTSQSAVSQHLSKLRTAGIVTFRRDAQHIYYSVAPESANRFFPAFVVFAEEDEHNDQLASATSQANLTMMGRALA